MGLVDLDETTGRIYEAALEPEVWPNVLTSIGDALGGCAFVMSWLKARGGAEFVTGARVDPDRLATIEQKYACPETNPLLAAMPRVPVAVPVARAAIQADADYLRGDLYNEVFRPQGLAHAAVACVLRTPTHFVYLGVLRRDNAKRPDQRDVELLGHLLSHMHRAVRLYLRLQERVRPPAWTLELLDSLPWGVILLDGNQCPVVVNREAERILHQADGLRLDRCGLFADCSADADRLRAVLDRATAPDGRGAAATDLALRRPSGAPALLLTIVPLGRRVLDLMSFSSLRAALHIVDPAHRPATGAERLRAFFGLTRAEAGLARAFIAGKSLHDYADEAQVTDETARWRLKQVLAKTDTHRQAELVRLLLASAVLG